LGLERHFGKSVEVLVPEPVDQRQWKANARSVLDGIAPGDADRVPFEATGWLHRFAQGDLSVPCLLMAATAARRLCPEVYLTAKQSLCMAELGSPRWSMNFLGEALNDVIGSRAEGTFQLTRGFAAFRAGDFGSASQAYQSAWRSGIQEVSVLACWALNAALADNVEQSLESALRTAGGVPSTTLEAVKINVGRFAPIGKDQARSLVRGRRTTEAMDVLHELFA
jgi:hypothetical protein